MAKRGHKGAGEVAISPNHRTDRDPADPATGLKPRELSFALHIGSMSGMSLAECYVAAGYTAETMGKLKAWANELACRVEVQEVAKKQVAGNQKRHVLSARNVLEELAILAFSSVNDFYMDAKTQTILPRPGVDPRAVRAIETVKMRHFVNPTTGEIEMQYDLKLHSKTKALEILARHFGLLGTDLPALDRLFAYLPTEVAGKLRAMLAATDEERLAMEEGVVVTESLVDFPPVSHKTAAGQLSSVENGGDEWSRGAQSGGRDSYPASQPKP